MPGEHQLHPGERMTLALQEGAEAFCASGAVRLTATPASTAGLGPLGLRAGQGWRASHALMLTVEAMEPSRLMMTAAPLDMEPRPVAASNKNSLLLWGRRLLGWPASA